MFPTTCSTTATAASTIAEFPPKLCTTGKEIMIVVISAVRLLPAEPLAMGQSLQEAGSNIRQL